MQHVSRVWVRRVRKWSPSGEMNTWVLCLRRRKAFECTIRSRSRWNGVRWEESCSGSSRRAGYERSASGESRSSWSSMRSRNEPGDVAAVRGTAPRLPLAAQRIERGRAVVHLIEKEAAREIVPAAGVDRVVGLLRRKRGAVGVGSPRYLLELADHRHALADREPLPIAAAGGLQLGRAEPNRPAAWARGRVTAAARHQRGGREQTRGALEAGHGLPRKASQESVVEPARLHMSRTTRPKSATLACGSATGREGPDDDDPGFGGVLNQSHWFSSYSGFEPLPVRVSLPSSMAAAQPPSSGPRVG